MLLISYNQYPNYGTRKILGDQLENGLLQNKLFRENSILLELLLKLKLALVVSFLNDIALKVCS